MKFRPSTRIKLFLNRLLSVLQQFGFNPLICVQSIFGLPRYINNIREFKSHAKAVQSPLEEITFNHESSWRFGMIYPILDEFKSTAGSDFGHYYHQDLYIAKQVYCAKPDLHLDVGSRIDGFIAHLLAFGQPTILGDVRPIYGRDENLSSVYFNLGDDLPVGNFEKYNSISSLHVIEHVGLGRYGDNIDPYGHIKAIRNLAARLMTHGVLYLSFPISKKSRIEFNAHRVISIPESLDIFAQLGLEVLNFAYVDDSGCLQQPSNLAEIDITNTYNLNYGCGIWTLTIK